MGRGEQLSPRPDGRRLPPTQPGPGYCTGSGKKGLFSLPARVQAGTRVSSCVGTWAGTTQGLSGPLACQLQMVGLLSPHNGRCARLSNVSPSPWAPQRPCLSAEPAHAMLGGRQCRGRHTMQPRCQVTRRRMTCTALLPSLPGGGSSNKPLHRFLSARKTGSYPSNKKSTIATNKTLGS